MVDFEVTCINKADRNSPYERIAFIGGIVQGQYRVVPLEEAVRQVETRQWRMYIRMDGFDFPLVVAVSTQQHKYLKTITDFNEDNNLLSLPECHP